MLAGRVIFSGRGEALDAPAGSLVFIDDPAERRAAVSAEDSSIVLSIGGSVGEAYRVAPWEFWFRVRAAREQGRGDEVSRILAEGLGAYPSDPTLRRLSGDGSSP